MEKTTEEQLPQQAQQTLLVDSEKYLKSGVHIGTRFKSSDMKKYIYKMRKDSLNVMDIQTIDQRIKFAARFLARFRAQKIAVVARRLYARTPAQEFAKAIGAKEITGRFVPGTFTNYSCSRFFEPHAVVIVEPELDKQAISEASKINVPVVALASTNNSLQNIDIAVPSNNKGRKSLALVMWLLGREYLKETKAIENDAEYSKKLEDFEYQMKDTDREEETEEGPRRRFGRFSDREKRPRRY